MVGLELCATALYPDILTYKWFDPAAWSYKLLVYGNHTETVSLRGVYEQGTWIHMVYIYI